MIIFDLDGTLADCEHRRHFVDVGLAVKKGIAYEDIYCNIGGFQSNGYFLEKDRDRRWKPDWQAFYEACDKDEPIEQVINIADLFFRKNIPYQIWSGRCESVREKTEAWLAKHDIQWTELKMRPIGDTTPDDELKEKWLNERCAELLDNRPCGLTFKNDHDIQMVFDDRPKVVRMWRRRGIFVFNCCQHNNEF